MTVKAWALRRTELRPLSDAAVLRVVVRCVQRAEPAFVRLWEDAPATAHDRWREGLGFVVAAMERRADTSIDTVSLARDVLSCGGRASALCGENTRGHLINNAFNVLSAAISAAAEAERKDLVTCAIVVGKHTASIAARHAHAGWVPADAAPDGDVVEFAGRALMDAVRADVAVLADVSGDLDLDRLTHSLGDLWPDGEPEWWARPR